MKIVPENNSGNDCPESGFTFVKTPRNLLYDQELSAGARLVYLALRDHCKNGDDECWPSRQRIAHDLGLSLRGVANALIELRKRGWISWTQRTHNSTGRNSNMYRVNAKLPQEVEADPAQEVEEDPAQEVEADPAPTSGTDCFYLGQDLPLPRAQSAQELDEEKKTKGTRRSELPARAAQHPVLDVFGQEPVAFPDRAQQVFERWRDAVSLDAKMPAEIKAGHQRKRMNRFVRTAIETVLAEFPFEDVLAAAQGWVYDDFDKRHSDYADLQYVLKPTNIDKFAAWHRNPKVRPSAAAAKPGGFMAPMSREEFENLSPEDMQFIPRSARHG